VRRGSGAPITVCGSVETGRFTPVGGVFAAAGMIGAVGTPDVDDDATCGGACVRL
jgi:hypothetical protein